MRRRCNNDIHLRRSIVHLRIFAIILDHLEASCSVSATTFVKYFQLFQEEPADKLYLHASNVLHSGNTFNIRLFSPQMSPEERLRQEEFANRILAIGEGRDTNNDTIQWSLNGIVSDNMSQSLANMIYPTLADPNASLPTAQHLAERAILVARNDTVDKLNE